MNDNYKEEFSGHVRHDGEVDKRWLKIAGRPGEKIRSEALGSRTKRKNLVKTIWKR